MTVFVLKKDAFYGRKLKKEGETVISDEKLDAIYPDLFRKNGVKPVAKVPAKQEVSVKGNGLDIVTGG